MWNCQGCGCQAIAASLGSCPMCRKGRDMPKTTVGGGGTNGLREPVVDADAVEPVVEAPEKVPAPITSTGSLALPKLGAQAPPAKPEDSGD